MKRSLYMYDQQFNPYGSNLSIVKGYFKSGKILTLAIFYIISVVFTIILNTSISFNTITYKVMEYLSQNGVDIPYEYRNALLSTSTASTIGTVLGSSIVPILTAVAFILMFVKSRNTAEDSSPIAGITIMHVLAIISLVFTIIGVVILGILYVIAFIASVTAVKSLSSGTSYSGSVTGSVTIIMVLIGIVYAVFAFLSIFYASSCKNFYRSAKRSITTSNLENKGATAYGVFNIIFAVFSFISMIVYMVIFAPYAGLVFSSYIVTILIQIFTAIVSIGYSKYINRQKNGINTAPYGGAPVQYAAPNSPYNAPAYANPQPSEPYTNSPAAPETAEPKSAQPQAQFCPNCGAKTEQDAPFCPNCGTKL